MAEDKKIDIRIYTPEEKPWQELLLSAKAILERARTDIILWSEIQKLAEGRIQRLNWIYGKKKFSKQRETSASEAEGRSEKAQS